MKKKFFRDGSDFKPIVTGFGSCVASDRITVDGLPVGFMYRLEPRDTYDSGWHFFAGDESQDYSEDPSHSGIYDVNTIANYDIQITPFIEIPANVAFVRQGTTFVVDNDFDFTQIA